MLVRRTARSSPLGPRCEPELQSKHPIRAKVLGPLTTLLVQPYASDLLLARHFSCAGPHGRDCAFVFLSYTTHRASHSPPSRPPQTPEPPNPKRRSYPLQRPCAPITSTHAVLTARHGHWTCYIKDGGFCAGLGTAKQQFPPGLSGHICNTGVYTFNATIRTGRRPRQLAGPAAAVASRFSAQHLD